MPLRQNSPGLPAGPYGMHLHLRQLGEGVSLALEHAKPGVVRAIGQGGGPAQVAEPVVLLPAVPMGSLMAFWPGANMSLQN